MKPFSYTVTCRRLSNHCQKLFHSNIFQLRDGIETGLIFSFWDTGLLTAGSHKITSAKEYTTHTVLSAIFSSEGPDRPQACRPRIFEVQRDTQRRMDNMLSKQMSLQRHLRGLAKLFGSSWTLQNLRVLISLHQGCRGSKNA